MPEVWLRRLPVLGAIHRSRYEHLPDFNVRLLSHTLVSASPCLIHLICVGLNPECHAFRRMLGTGDLTLSCGQTVCAYPQQPLGAEIRYRVFPFVLEEDPTRDDEPAQSALTGKAWMREPNGIVSWPV